MYPELASATSRRCLCPDVTLLIIDVQMDKALLRLH